MTNPFAPKFARSRRDALRPAGPTPGPSPEPTPSIVDLPEGGSGESTVDTPEVEKPKRAKAAKPLRRSGSTTRKPRGKGKTT